MKHLILGVAVMAIFGPVAAQARPYHLTTVRWIVATRNNLDVDDRYVTIVGHVTRRMGSEEYWFTDGTGSVRLDSENFDLPVGPRLMIGGRIDQAYLGFGHIEVDVRKWRYAPLHLVRAGEHVGTMTRTTAAAPSMSPPPSPPPHVTSAPTPTPITTPAPMVSTNPPPLAPPTESSGAAPAEPNSTTASGPITTPAGTNAP